MVITPYLWYYSYSRRRTDRSEDDRRMPAERRPFLGAFALAIFITACFGWLIRGAGVSFNVWGYLILLMLCAWLMHGLAGLLRNGRSKGGRVRSVDVYSELD
jgi:hypothetical protein